MVAVVGAGHLKGLTGRLDADMPRDPGGRLSSLEKVPEGKWPWYRIAGYGFIAVFFLLIGYYAYIGDWDALGRVAVLWLLTNGVCAAAAVAVARGHPLSVAVAFFAAPVTSLNPSIGAGWVAGFVEAKLRTPTVLDMTTLGRLESWEAFTGNRAVKVLLVAALGNLGSTIGTVMFWVLLPSMETLPLPV